MTKDQLIEIRRDILEAWSAAEAGMLRFTLIEKKLKSKIAALDELIYNYKEVNNGSMGK